MRGFLLALLVGCSSQSAEPQIVKMESVVPKPTVMRPAREIHAVTYRLAIAGTAGTISFVPTSRGTTWEWDIGDERGSQDLNASLADLPSTFLAALDLHSMGSDRSRMRLVTSALDRAIAKHTGRTHDALLDAGSITDGMTSLAIVEDLPRVPVITGFPLPFPSDARVSSQISKGGHTTVLLVTKQPIAVVQKFYRAAFESSGLELSRRIAAKDLLQLEGRKPGAEAHVAIARSDGEALVVLEWKKT